MAKQEQLIVDIKERYDRLNSYRSVAAELDNVVSCSMIRKIVRDGAWSPTVARKIWPAKKRNRVWMRTDNIDRAIKTLLQHYLEIVAVVFYEESEG